MAAAILVAGTALSGEMQYATLARERGQHRRDFAAARRRAHGAGDRTRVEDDGGVLDEHRVGVVGAGVDGGHGDAEFFEQRAVVGMLAARGGDIDRRARDEREFAVGEARRYGVDDGAHQWASACRSSANVSSSPTNRSLGIRNRCLMAL